MRKPITKPAEAKSLSALIDLPGIGLLNEWFSGKRVPDRKKARGPFKLYNVYRVYHKNPGS